ncbi:M15 family metallopeptidase [Paenibacillus sp. FSL H8-0259]|uniref:M15 family metallopeptidase n=1 Tax=Paenibacillus sp. FSL H8-0259 TaxID=1920423 RepID=UPI0021169A71|nr:M15 family metallopeptidase [Paenibacillus sp. FSL H8-0259]
MSLTLEQVKLKSDSKLPGLQPVIAAGMIALITGCYNRGVQIIITQGLRTYAEQDNLYAKGRTAKQLAAVGLSKVTPQPKEDVVTNARGGYSNHNFGYAFDFALLLPDGRTVCWDTLRDDDKDSLPDWSEVVEEAKKLGFEWGGDWRTFKDMPHLQMVFGLTTTQLRGGKKPAVSLIAKAFAVVDKYMEAIEEMTAQEKKEFETMQLLIKAHAEVTVGLSNRITELENAAKLPLIPKWALSACEAAKAAGYLDTTANGSYDFYRMITIMDRIGLFKKGAK